MNIINQALCPICHSQAARVSDPKDSFVEFRCSSPTCGSSRVSDSIIRLVELGMCDPTLMTVMIEKDGVRWLIPIPPSDRYGEPKV